MMACRLACGRGRHHLDFIFYLIKFSTPSPTVLMLLTVWNWEHWKKVLEEERQMLYVSSLFVCLFNVALLPFIMGTVEKLTFFFKVHFCVWDIVLPCSPAGIFTLSSSLTLWCIPCPITYTLFHLLSGKQEMAEKPNIFLLSPSPHWPALLGELLLRRQGSDST